MDEYAHYRSYVIRLWPGEHEGRASCRATLNTVESGRRYDFPELDDLIDFLRSEEAALTDVNVDRDPTNDTSSERNQG